MTGKVTFGVGNTPQERAAMMNDVAVQKRIARVYNQGKDIKAKITMDQQIAPVFNKSYNQKVDVSEAKAKLLDRMGNLDGKKFGETSLTDTEKQIFKELEETKKFNKTNGQNMSKQITAGRNAKESFYNSPEFTKQIDKMDKKLEPLSPEQTMKKYQKRAHDAQRRFYNSKNFASQMDEMEKSLDTKKADKNFFKKIGDFFKRNKAAKENVEKTPKTGSSLLSKAGKTTGNFFKKAGKSTGGLFSNIGKFAKGKGKFGLIIGGVAALSGAIGFFAGKSYGKKDAEVMTKAENTSSTVASDDKTETKPTNNAATKEISAVVRFGDTIEKISKRYNVSAEEIMKNKTKEFQHRTDENKKVIGFLVGETIKLEVANDFDVEKSEKDITKEAEIAKYKKWYENHNKDEDCSKWVA